jgi:hypothetical protein
MKIRKIVSAVASAALLSGLVALPMEAQAASKAFLAGKWTMVLVGNTGCGIHSMYVTMTLNTLGVGTANIANHSTGCPNSLQIGLPFNIVALAANGEGTANLSCGAGCGWGFRIQVAADGNTMILTDVDAANPKNTPTGTALRQWPL